MRCRLCRRLLAALCFALALTPLARAEGLSIGGTGSAEPIVRLLFEEFRKQSPEINLNLVSPPLGSGGGIAALMAGRIDMAFISRSLKPQEQAALGAAVEICKTPFVLASRGGQRRAGFTLDELASVYEAQVPTWENGVPVRIVMRTTDDSDSKTLASMSPAVAEALKHAHQRAGMVLAMDDMETLDLLARTPGSLGPTNLALLRAAGSQLIVFPINGVTPSAATLRNGSYPWSKTLTMVAPARPSPGAEKFARFVQSSPARSLLQRIECQ